MQSIKKSLIIMIITPTLTMGTIYNATASNDLDCADCYYCTQYDDGNCIGECVYDATFCTADSPYNENGCAYFETLFYQIESEGLCPTNDTADLAEWACNAVDDYEDCVNFLNSDIERFVTAICNNINDVYTASKNSGILGCSIGEASGDTSEDISNYCETIIALENNCARYIITPDNNTSDTYVYLNCDGTGTPYNEYLAAAMCGDNSVCFDTLLNDWYTYTDALCYSSNAAEMADYLGYDCTTAGYNMDFAVSCDTCNYNYYYNGSSCTPCPTQDGATGATDYSGFQTPISMCYMPTTTNLTDSTGTYHFTINCPYSY